VLGHLGLEELTRHRLQELLKPIIALEQVLQLVAVEVSSMVAIAKKLG